MAEFVGCMAGLRRIDVAPTKRVKMAATHVRRQYRRRRAWKSFQTIAIDDAERLLVAHVARSRSTVPERLFPEKTGVVWVTPHFGDFMTGIAILSRFHRAAGRSLSVMLSDTYDVANVQYGALAKALDVEFLSANLLVAARRLREGQGVVVLIDAVYPLPSMRFVPFMGTMIGMMGLAPRLSAISGAGLRPFYCLDRGAAPVLHVDPAIIVRKTESKSADAYLGCSMIARWMEDLIHRHPASWHHWNRLERQLISHVERPELLTRYNRWIDHAVATGGVG